MKRFWFLLLLLAAIGCSRGYDIVIVNGRILDGSGSEAVQADIAVKAGKIVKIESGIKAKADMRIDASGLVVSPGFIDIHTHAERKLLGFPQAENYLTQGVTTVVGGNCGGSPLPLKDYFRRADSVKIAVNLALLVGHNTVRRSVMGDENRAPTTEELEHMKSLVRQAMEDGAFGLSTGLKYIPGAYSKTKEVVELARVVAEFGGLYATHMRDEGLQLFPSIREALQIGSLAGLPVEISHFKAIGKTMWGSAERMLALVDSARAAGVDVTFDQYPYTATSTGLSVLLPRWALAGGRERYLKKWQDPGFRRKVKDGIIFNLEKDRGGGDPANVVIAQCKSDSTLNGLNLRQITQRFFGRVTMENAAETVLRLLENGTPSCVFHCLNEEDVQTIMRHPFGMIASDSHITSPDEGFPHPRNYGTFPRVLGRYVRELKILSLPEAIGKMTGDVADRLGLQDRGLIREGSWADLVIFDPETIQDNATWKEPKKRSTGILFVIVNGQIELERGHLTGVRAGKILRRSSKKEEMSRK